MKWTLISVIIIGMSFSTYASTNSCEEQKTDLAAKLATAKSSNNRYAQQGLEIALSNVKMYCSDEQQENRAKQSVQEKQQKVNQANKELKSTENELVEVEGNGDTSEISHKKNRVDEKERRLESAIMELKQAQDEYKKLMK
jgi:DNA repair exonuclease SbcCD ATPase subunit